jgi:hypothetical protein
MTLYQVLHELQIVLALILQDPEREVAPAPESISA